MNYNTEEIRRIAEEVAKLVQGSMRQTQSESQEVETMAEFELAFREALRQIGGAALGIFLSALQATPARELACACGGRLHYQRRRPAILTTVFGKVEYTRAYYAGCACGCGVAPLDQTYGLEAGAISSGLAQLLAVAGIEFSFEESQQWLKEFLLFEVSENSIRSETQQMGHLQRKMKQSKFKRARMRTPCKCVYEKKNRSRSACMARWMPPKSALNPVRGRGNLSRTMKTGGI